MNKAEAMKELRKRYGAKGAYRENPRAPNADEKAAIRAELPMLKEAEDAFSNALEKRRAEILAADPEYQRLLVETRSAREAREKARSLLLSARRVVGYVVGLGDFSAFKVEGEGDNWTDAFADADRRKGKL